MGDLIFTMDNPKSRIILKQLRSNSNLVTSNDN